MNNDLLEAIEQGNVDLIQETFNAIMADKIQDNLEHLKQNIAKNLVIDTEE
jgi:hypothetical protein